MDIDSTSSTKITHCLTELGSAGGGIPPSVRGLIDAERLSGLHSLAIGSGLLDDWTPGTAIALSRNVFKPLGGLVGLAQHIALSNPDIVSVHGLWQHTSCAARSWGNKTGRPVIVHPHGMLDPWALNNSAWKKQLALLLFERRCLREATVIRALCSEEKDSIRLLGLKSPIAVIPNGIDIPDSGGPQLSPPWAGTPLDGRPVVLFLGRIHPKKGVMNLLRAFAGCRGSLKGLGLVIAGWDDGGHLRNLQSYICESDLSDDVLIIGPCFGARKHAAYRSSVGFILPSLSEGLPMTVLEAWSYKLPVLMSRFCNLSEGFMAGAAMRCEPDVESISNSLKIFSSMSDHDRGSMGRCGYELILKKFTWSVVASEINLVYKWVLGGGLRPATICEE